MSKTLNESKLKAAAEEIFITHPKQREAHVTKDGCVFLSENKNAAELHAKSIGKATEVFTFKNDNVQVDDSDENEEDSDDEFDLDPKGGKSEDTEVLPTEKSKVEEIKAYLTLKEITIPEEAKTKAQLLALLPTVKKEGE